MSLGGLGDTSFHLCLEEMDKPYRLLQAIVSGAIGGYLDVAFNFNTQAFHDDNLLG